MYTEAPWNDNQVPGFLRTVPVKARSLLPIHQESAGEVSWVGKAGRVSPSLPAQLVRSGKPTPTDQFLFNWECFSISY